MSEDYCCPVCRDTHMVEELLDERQGGDSIIVPCPLCGVDDEEAPNDPA